MPQYFFVCPVCHWPERRILSPEESKDPIPCTMTEGCSGILKRTPKPPTSKIVETLDNGAMPRRLERLADAERIFEERARGKKGNL